MKISILYAYRNREIGRIKRSLDSVEATTSTKFEVLFIDYGSNSELATQVKSFITMILQPMNIFILSCNLGINQSIKLCYKRS
jgi:glycosyltransferase involved in cell wall biosynthesis